MEKHEKSWNYVYVFATWVGVLNKIPFLHLQKFDNVGCWFENIQIILNINLLSLGLKYTIS